MNNDIKTVLTDEQKVQFVTDICGYGTGLVTPLFAIVDSIERAVLEAARASSAMAMQAVDAQRITEIWRECQTTAAKEFFETVRPDGVTGKYSVPVRFAYALFAEVALQSQQSPVQASEPIPQWAKEEWPDMDLQDWADFKVWSAERAAKKASDAGRQG